MDRIALPAHLRHHSLADWLLGIACLIDDTHFVSDPTSISNDHGAQCYATLDAEDAFNVTYGRCTFFLYPVPGTPDWYPRTGFAFRCHHSPSYPLSRRFYYILIYHNQVPPEEPAHVQLFRVVNLFPTLLASAPHFPILDTWHRYRITWVPDCTKPHPKPLNITLSWFTDDWHDILTYSDPVNLGWDQPSNQIGFSLFADQHWLDDLLLEDYPEPIP